MERGAIRSNWNTKGALLALALLFLHISVGERYSLSQRLMGALPGMCAVYMGWLYLAHRRFDHVPFMEYCLVHWYVFLAMPTITSAEGQGIPVSDESLTRALLAVDLLTVTGLAAYWLGRRLGRPSRRAIDLILPNMPSDAVSLVFWPWLALAASLNTGILEGLPRWLHYPASTLGSYVPLIALEMLRVHGAKRERSSRLIIATVVLAAAGLFSGRMSNVLTPLLTVGLLQMLLRGRVPWRAMGMFFVLMVLLQPAKLIYRSMAWEGGDRTPGSIGDTFDRWIGAFGQAWIEDSGPTVEESALEENLDKLSNRLDALSSSAACFELVPGVIPYDRGAMWKYLFVAPIPRFLYPSKPNPTYIYNNRYSITFGLQTEKAAEESTFVFPIIADGYWNFGWLGVVIVGLVSGLLLGMYDASLNPWRWGSISLALALIVDARFHGHLAYQVGGLFQTLLGTAIICWTVWFLTLSWQRRPALVLPPRRERST